MVAKRAVPKKQDTSRVETGMQAAREAGRAFQTALEQCVLTAEPEAVHRVRTGSRRLQAMIEATTPPEAFGKLTKARLRLLKKIRRAAGPVRDLDVQRQLLEHKLLGDWSGSEIEPALRGQAQELGTWLKDRRNGHAEEMRRAILKPQRRLAALGELPTFAAGNSGKADAVAMDFFAQAAFAMPQLDAENLHDFRKAVKKARYIAEGGSLKNASEPTSVAKALKKVQDAIGEWHDWACLEQDAHEVLGKDAPELMAALKAEVRGHFSSALITTEATRGRLLGEWQAGKRPAARSTAPRSRGTA